eukprot:TRINITY_DN4250_c0_g1_i1.p1 TRINITY_DN4250_c0_g1~~TRINITY_DN4250_c0_g1_i1.p1  ORF type:complete len:337 (+),score=43.48 TRINITY_DN4250_c0_g1_i1:64-1074(+)
MEPLQLRTRRDPMTMKNAVKPQEAIPSSWNTYPAQFRWRLLFAKAQCGDLEGFMLLHQQQESLLHYMGSVQESVLHHAIHSKNWALCDYIIKAGLDPFWSAKFNSEESWSPLDFSLTDKGPLFTMITEKNPTFDECSICQATQNLYPLECGHYFCYPCLKSWLQTSVQSNQDCVCPDRNCGIVLTDQKDIKFLLKDSYQIYLQHRLRESLSPLPDYLWCPFCPSGFFVDRDDDSCKTVQCHHCNTNLCTGCKWTSHEGTCDEARLKLLELHGKENEESEQWKRNNTKQCPKCQVHIEKNQGCSHMRCYSCQYEFCWICLGKYVGKHTTGDICPCKS